MGDLALVLQDPVLFKGTIADNIRLGRPDLTDEEMMQAARHVGVHDFIMQLPGNYNHVLQERGTNISAGQRQLISFARALAYNPQAILILDEATSSVDTESEAIIQEALKKLKGPRECARGDGAGELRAQTRQTISILRRRLSLAVTC